MIFLEFIASGEQTYTTVWIAANMGLVVEGTKTSFAGAATDNTSAN